MAITQLKSLAGTLVEVSEGLQASSEVPQSPVLVPGPPSQPRRDSSSSAGRVGLSFGNSAGGSSGTWSCQGDRKLPLLAFVTMRNSCNTVAAELKAGRWAAVPGGGRKERVPREVD